MKKRLSRMKEVAGGQSVPRSRISGRIEEADIMEWLDCERDLIPMKWDYLPALDAWRVFVPDWQNPEAAMRRWVDSRTFALLLARERAAAYQQNVYIYEPATAHWQTIYICERTGYRKAEERQRYRVALDHELAKAIIGENNRLVVHLVVHPDGSTE